MNSDLGVRIFITQVKSSIMKPALLTIITMLYAIVIVNAQNNDVENEIREMEKAEVAAVLKHDTNSLESIWADDFAINLPYNIVGIRKRGDAVNLFYSKFERNIETIIVKSDQLVITMGGEVINRKPPMTMAGQTLTRRFTHVWIKSNGKWQLAARHANFICPDMPKQQTQ